jgi:nitrogen regulatory protein P-II 1
MKMVWAVIQPTRLRAIREALYEAGVQRITICDSQEFAKHTGRIPIYRGVEYRTEILRKITLEIAVNDDFLDRTVEIIERVGKTGDDGDGKIFVFTMNEAVEFHPRVSGPGAL